ncbi:MAG: gamma-glutamylcyclotransferase family protein [Acidobacteriota bacterium]
MTDFLFVYGTLRGDAQNPWARHLRAEAELVGPATVRGSIFRIAHYPAYRPEPDGEVQGDVFRLTDPTRVFSLLDDYEGPSYTRVRIPVSTGEFAWIYQYNRQPPLSSRIASGDFREK